MKLNFKNDYNTIGDYKILNALLELRDEKTLAMVRIIIQLS